MQDFDHFSGAQLGAHLDSVAQSMGFQWDDDYKAITVSNKTLGLPEGGESDQTNRYMVTDLSVHHAAPLRRKLGLDVEDARDFGRITRFTLAGDAPLLKVQHESLLGHAVDIPYDPITRKYEEAVRSRSQLSEDSLEALKAQRPAVVPHGWKVSAATTLNTLEATRYYGSNPEPAEWDTETSVAYEEDAIRDNQSTGTVVEEKMPHPKTLDSMQKFGGEIRVARREEDPDNIDMPEVWDHVLKEKDPNASTLNFINSSVVGHREDVARAKDGLNSKPIVPPGQVRVTLDRHLVPDSGEVLPEMLVSPSYNKRGVANFSFNNLSGQFERMPD